MRSSSRDVCRVVPIQAAAARCGVTRRTASRWVRDGSWRTYRRSRDGRRVYVPVDDVERTLRRRVPSFATLRRRLGRRALTLDEYVAFGIGGHPFTLVPPTTWRGRRPSSDLTVAAALGVHDHSHMRVGWTPVSLAPEDDENLKNEIGDIRGPH